MTVTKDHYINLKNGEFDSTSRADLRHLFSSLVGDDHGDTLVVHFHGGLVNEKVGMRNASRLLSAYRSAQSYPVFFVWESGLLEVLSHNLGNIAQEKVFQRLLSRLFSSPLPRLQRCIARQGS